MPQRFVQLAGDTSERDLVDILEAIEAQRAARLRSWITLPEGQKVVVSGIAQAEKGTQQDFHESVLGTIGSPHSVGGQFLYTLEGRGRWRTDASCVYPLVERRAELRALERLEQAQRQAASFTFDLPVGQLVEAHGKLMVTTAACDGQSYKLRALGASPQERMAAAYSVADLLHLSYGQLVDLWERFGLPRQKHRSPDTYIEEAMRFLPPEKPTPSEVSCLEVRPLITDASELAQLRARHRIAERCGVAPATGPRVCATCGGHIRGCVASCDGRSYHFGCAPSHYQA